MGSRISRSRKMTNPLTILPPRLILFAGHAGTGKSTLAKRALPMIVERTGEDFFLLDKDTVYGSFSSHVMELTTGNSNDRDSPYYLENLRDWEYAGLLDIVRENLLLGVNVILVGPFSREIQNGMMFDACRMKLPQETHIRLAWIDLKAEEARSRIQLRADARDDWKLANWDSYIKRRVEPPSNLILKRYGNETFDEKKFDALIEHLVS